MGTEPYCVLHYGVDKRASDELAVNPQFESCFASVLQNRDGNWRGFVFPPGIALPKEIDFPIGAQGCRFEALRLENVTFKERADFSGSLFKGSLSLSGVTFSDRVDFQGCRFDCPVDLANTHCLGDATFASSDFGQRAILRVNFCKPVIFSEAVFRDGVNFAGWRNITAKLSGAVSVTATGNFGIVFTGKRSIGVRLKKSLFAIWQYLSRAARHVRNEIKLSLRRGINAVNRIRRRFAATSPDERVFRVFEDEAHFEGVVFLKPDQTLFTQVDLSRVHFRGTNLRGVRFLGVSWWQPRFKRNGLYDEVWVKESPDGPHRARSMPVLEETCRNARVSLEENRSYSVATDFYVAEMEAARAQLGLFRRHIFSVNALYRTSTRYGASVAVGFRTLAFLLVIHVLLSLIVLATNDVVLTAQHVSETGLRSVRVMLLHAPESAEGQLPLRQGWLDTAFRLLGVAQMAMIVLAFRSRIKRH